MVEDLRSAVEELKKYENQIACTDTEVDSYAEVAGIYRYVGAGGTVKRPTKEGPALLFRNIKGFPDKQVLIGLLASRKRVGYLLDCPPDKLGFLLKDAAANPVMPEFTESGDVPCQEEILYASDEGFDIRKILPALRIRRRMQAHTLPWACATPPIPLREMGT